VFGAYRRAALGYVAKTDTLFVLQFQSTVFRIQWMHFKGSGINHVPGAGEAFVEMVFAQHVANILAKEALDAFSEFLYPVDIALRNPPGTIRSIGSAGLELPDPLLDMVVHRNIGNKVANHGKGLHRLNGDRFIFRHVCHAGHAHEPGMTIDLG
jgi:hypothetical protein